MRVVSPVSQELRRLPSAREVPLIVLSEQQAAGTRWRSNAFNTPPGPGPRQAKSRERTIQAHTARRAKPHPGHQGARKHEVCRRQWGSQQWDSDDATDERVSLLPDFVGAYQRYTCRLRAVSDAQRQKLLRGGDVERSPSPIAALQMTVPSLTPAKLATLMAQGADMIAIRETWKSAEQIASMHTGEYVPHAQSRIRKECVAAVLVRKNLRSKRMTLITPQRDSSLDVVVQFALGQNRDLIVASTHMRPPPQPTQPLGGC
ncbi:putative Endonuclease-reverse transcriptase [Trypanosoma cruzi]|uniref:Putative Endonuclease-reverse transcriptase n=1 Tax=Trypanosoma cruzi TaxID=5693 RepID=A0A2V2UY63_TRYCR|nr:putative Endonuclease-reverse transcriptase [Trypanosoma cruzi]